VDSARYLRLHASRRLISSPGIGKPEYESARDDRFGTRAEWGVGFSVVLTALPGALNRALERRSLKDVIVSALLVVRP
jgi:hypothetical protein